MPSLAVQWDRRGSFVWKVVDGAARRADVAIVRRQSGVVVVEGDVAAGDTVVVEGIQRLREGAKVAEVDETPTIVEESDAPAGDTPAAEERAGGQRRRAAPTRRGAERMAKHLEDARARLTEATKGISALCVRRPVLTIVVNLLIVLAGLAAFRGVEIREMPDVDRPVITIRASL